MRIQLVGCTKQLIQEAGTKELKQKNIALTYAMAILSDEEKDWPKINQAIIKRWSKSGLTRVKTMAWKLIEEKRREYIKLTSKEVGDE